MELDAADRLRILHDFYRAGDEGSFHFDMYVTWACKGRNNYFWGHYFTDPLEAKKDLLGRANEELEYQMERRARASERQPKEPDKDDIF